MNQSKWGYFYLINTVFFFSTYEAVSKTLVGKIDPLQINFLRFFFGGLILLGFTIYKSNLWISLKDFFWVSIAGITNVVISMSLIQWSIFSSNSRVSVVAVIFSSNPIFVTIFAAIIDKERISLYKIIGLIVGIIGIVVIFFEKLQSGVGDIKSPMLALLSAITYGIYTVIGKKVSGRIGSLKMNSYSFIIGSIVLIPVLLAIRVPFYKFELSGIWQIVYLSVFVTGLAYLTYFKGLSIVGASSGSMVFFIKPALASIIAIIFLKEKATFNLFAGTLLIVIGIAIAIYWPKVKKRSNSKVML